MLNYIFPQSAHTKADVFHRAPITSSLSACYSEYCYSEYFYSDYCRGHTGFTSADSAHDGELWSAREQLIMTALYVKNECQPNHDAVLSNTKVHVP